jgi:hypothetical protein
MPDQSNRKSTEAASYIALWLAINGGDPAHKGAISKEQARDIAAHIITTMSSYLISYSETKLGEGDIEQGLANFGAKIVDSPEKKAEDVQPKVLVVCISGPGGQRYCVPYRPRPVLI